VSKGRHREREGQCDGPSLTQDTSVAGTDSLNITRLVVNEEIAERDVSGSLTEHFAKILRCFW